MRIFNPFLTLTELVPDNLKLLPPRRVNVNGKPFIIPQHINRIDSVTTSGWQVRYKNNNRFFGDSGLSENSSLKEAIKWLSEIYKG